MPNILKITASKEELIKMYRDDFMSIREIARKFGVKDSSVCAHFNKVGIRLRRAKHGCAVITDEELKKAYTDNGIDIHRISHSTGIPESRIYWQLRKCGIPIKIKDQSKGDKWQITTFGYKKVWVDGKWKYEHRHVVESALGIKLNSKQHVHHKNRDKLDNRIENLEVLDASEHWKITYSQGAGSYMQLRSELKASKEEVCKLKNTCNRYQKQIQRLKALVAQIAAK